MSEEAIVNRNRLEKADRNILVTLSDTTAYMLSYYAEKMHTNPRSLAIDMIKDQCFLQLEMEIGQGKAKKLKKAWEK